VGSPGAAASTTNVSKPGAVKRGRNGSGTSLNDPGRLPTRSIGALFSKRYYGNADAFFMP
jgi:hypothetical protein